MNWVQAAAKLARQLRWLREKSWPDLKVTQLQIAEALGGGQPLSESLISSWESTRNPSLPPPNRLRGYATFFATRRSVETRPARLLDDHELTPAELARRDDLLEELTRMRFPEETESAVPPTGDPAGGGVWHFPDQRPVTIVTARLPKTLRDKMPFVEPHDPDYVRAHSYADLDALIDLFGHIRAVNPSIAVNVRLADVLENDDYTTHLVLLGGVDWNDVSSDIVRRLDLPVRQIPRSDEDLYGGHFEVGPDKTVITSALERIGDQITLREDVGYFFRGINPYNARRTVTLCNGMYARGTYGVVRALTHELFRDRNEEYLAERFRGALSFGVLTKIPIAINGEALTPDWMIRRDQLFEWPSDG